MRAFGQDWRSRCHHAEVHQTPDAVICLACDTECSLEVGPPLCAATEADLACTRPAGHPGRHEHGADHHWQPRPDQTAAGAPRDRSRTARAKNQDRTRAQQRQLKGAVHITIHHVQLPDVGPTLAQRAALEAAAPRPCPRCGTTHSPLAYCPVRA